MPETDVTTTRPAHVKSFVRRFRTDILAQWRVQARELPGARDLSPVVLVDHVPELLDEIAIIADVLLDDSTNESPFETARRHAVDRLGEGFDIEVVVREMSLLRGAIHTVWRKENVGANLRELTMLDLAIDRAIAVSVARYTEAHQRTLAGIDRISTASFESSSVSDLLQRLLSVFMETTPAVDTAAILLREGDRLYLRAAVGLDDELRRGFSVAIGEGFGGTIASKRAPLALRAAYMDPIVTSQEVRLKGVRALYGVPLLHHDEVIGVAHMGSLTANEFSQEDRQFFGSMAGRATAGIVHHMLRQELAQSEERFKQIAAERERALSKLESLLAASPIGIAFVDRDLRFLRINDAHAAINGVPAGAHLGRTVREVLPAVADAFESLLRGVIETGQPALNLEVPLPDGRSLLATYFPVRVGEQVTGVGSIVMDVTETKRAHEALAAEQVRSHSILEHAPAAIWVKDAEGHVVLANQRLAEALGHDLSALLGRRSQDVLPPELAASHIAHDETVLRENRAIEVEETVPSPQGPRTFLSIKFPIPGDPPLVGAVATEITQRKQMEEELRSAVRAREEILAVVSHDLRNPLGSVQLAAAMLMSHFGFESRGRRPIETILRSCTRMENLIDDLLDTANIRAGRLHLDRKREMAHSVAGEAVELQRPIAEEKGIALEYRPSDGVPILGDRDRLLQVFSNLIGNAFKFGRAGDTVRIEDEVRGDFVVFSVRDSGPGISPELLPFLFEPYWSADRTRRGSGLGLYISRGIVEGHGGKIWVESTPGQGAKFLFSIPRAK
jgi:PAS domain S-box-containing protein